MPSTLPDGDPMPPDGSLPDQARQGAADRTLSFYVHVPFCATRCGYCDFNTYTAGELGAASPQSRWTRRWPRSSWPCGCWAGGDGCRRCSWAAAPCRWSAPSR
ncbi:MAG: hypothetical protein U0R72_16570 [Nakamurella multipartita]